MIIGIGSDFINADRIEKAIKKFGQKFLDRIYVEHEQNKAKKYANPINFYGKRFAAKEAAVKALGTGIAEGVSWTDFWVENLESGKPILHIDGEAKKKLTEMMPENHNYHLHLTISDDNSWIQAFVIIEARLNK